MKKRQSGPHQQQWSVLRRSYSSFTVRFSWLLWWDSRKIHCHSNVDGGPVPTEGKAGLWHPESVEGLWPLSVTSRTQNLFPTDGRFWITLPVLPSVFFHWSLSCEHHLSHLIVSGSCFPCACNGPLLSPITLPSSTPPPLLPQTPHLFSALHLWLPHPQQSNYSSGFSDLSQAVPGAPVRAGSRWYEGFPLGRPGSQACPQAGDCSSSCNTEICFAHPMGQRRGEVGTERSGKAAEQGVDHEKVAALWSWLGCLRPQDGVWPVRPQPKGRQWSLS